MARQNTATESAEMRKSSSDQAQSQYSCGFATSEGTGHSYGQSAETMRKLSQSPLYSAEPGPVATQGDKQAKTRPEVVADASPPSLETKAPPKKSAAKVALTSPPETWAVAELAPHERAVIDAALAIVAARMSTAKNYLDSVTRARDMAVLHLGYLDHECFGVFFLDTQHRLICFEQMFRGTLTQTPVYPREVARRALRLNAASVVLAHNHPSGMLKPSQADEQLTRTLKATLSMFDVRVLDHIIVGGSKSLSMAECGLI
jgi:DNA repair protein RadC